MYLQNTLKYGVFFTVGAALVALIAIGIDEGIKSLDSMLIPCQHGTTYTSSGSCSGIDTPFIGKYCGICNCSNGYCVIGGTNPRITSDGVNVLPTLNFLGSYVTNVGLSIKRIQMIF